jgi:Mitochondrial carrier protein
MHICLPQDWAGRWPFVSKRQVLTARCHIYSVARYCQTRDRVYAQHKQQSQWVLVHVGGQLSPTLQYIAASVGAGSLNVCVTNPLWVVKTRLQTQNMPKEFRGSHHSHTTNYKSTFDALAQMTRKEGVRGLYSGLVPSIIGVAHVAIQFPLYEALKKRAGALRGCEQDCLSAPDLVALSSLAKMVASTATYPHEVIRSQMHVSKGGAMGVRAVCVRVRSQTLQPRQLRPDPPQGRLSCVGCVIILCCVHLQPVAM